MSGLLWIISWTLTCPSLCFPNLVVSVLWSGVPHFFSSGGGEEATPVSGLLPPRSFTFSCLLTRWGGIFLTHPDYSLVHVLLPLWLLILNTFPSSLLLFAKNPLLLAMLRVAYNTTLPVLPSAWFVPFPCSSPVGLSGWWRSNKLFETQYSACVLTEDQFKWWSNKWFILLKEK